MRNKLVKILAGSLIPVLIMPLFLVPLTVQAQSLGGSIPNFVACAAGGFLAGLISKFTDSLTDFMPGGIGNLLGISLQPSGSFVPVSDEVTHKLLQKQIELWTSKETRQDLVARCTARGVFNSMVSNALNIIRTNGRDGGPTFIQNWRNFVTSSQYRGEDVFRVLLGNTQLCPDFGVILQNQFGVSTTGGNFPTIPLGQNTRVGDLDPFARRARCTMPTGWSILNYTQDFINNGGWEALIRLAEPQNNPYGVFVMSLDELETQRGLEQELDVLETTGHGFTSRRGGNSTESCLLAGANGQCIVYNDVLTPGSILQQNVNNTFNQEYAWVTNTDELQEIIASLINQVLNRLLNLADSNEARSIPAPPAP